MQLPQSPLKLRASLRRLKRCSHRRNILFRLLCPLPWHFPLPSPKQPAQLAADRGRILIQPNILQLHSIPLFRIRDTPLCSLYRLYEDLCVGNILMLSYESDYFFSHTEAAWKLSEMPDPQDSDPVRYALLASFAEALVDAFNWKLEQGLRRGGTQNAGSDHGGLETLPRWTERVKPLPERLNLRPNNNESADPNFLKRNIQAPMGYLYCV